MYFNRILPIFIIAIHFIACNSTIEFSLNAPDKIKIDENLELSINSDQANVNVNYFIDDVAIENHKAINLQNYTLGKHIIKAVVKNGDKTISKQKTVVFLNSQKPTIYTYKVLQSYPHDRTSFTQGLEFHNNFLYEGTGQRGQSVLRKIELETGNVLQEQALAKKYFGEGITIFDNKIYQLTWQHKIGFIYNIDTFKVEKTFAYENSLEGWGLTHDTQNLIKTDGTEKIWFLNPKNGKEQHHIEAYTNKRRVDNLNEIEYIDGKIYANVWTKNAIAIINPKNGAVEGIVNMKDLAKQLDNKTVIESSDKVLNGIAYNPLTKKLYVTGKNWDKIFEIEIVK